MAEQTLREALKELRAYCGRHVDDPRASEDEQVAYDDVCIQLAQILQKHPAPLAGDGGLREALEKLADEYADELGTVSYQWLSEKTLKPLLAAHPAAPAVPQPIERAVCNACGWEGEPVHDICPACRQDTLNYFTPASGSAVPQPIEREALVEVLADELAGWMDVTPSSRWEVAKSLAGRVLAVLAGEQEQVQ